MSNTMIFTLLGVDKLSPVFRSAGTESAKAGQKIGGSFKSAEGGVTKSTGLMRRGLANTFTGLKGLVAPALAAFTALGAIGIAKTSITAYQNAGVEVMRLQRVAGGTAEQMSRLRTAAILSGIGTDALTKGLRLGSKALVNTEGNAKATAKMVKLLGFNYQDAHGKVLPWNVLLPKIADKFKNMPAGPQKTALAMKIFGRAGTDMLPFLNRGSAGIAALAAQSDKLGTTMSGKNLKAIAAYRLEQRKFNLQMEGVKITIGKALLPVMMVLMTLMVRFISQMHNGTGAGGAFVTVLRGFATVIKAVATPLKDTVGFLWDFKVPIAITAALIATVFIPHLIAMGVAATISGAETAAVWLMLKRDAIAGAAAHSWAVVRIVAGWVVMGVQSMIQAGRMAVAWVIALGPIAWVAVAIAALVALVIWKWKAISTWTTKTFGGMASTVKNFFVGLPGKIGDVAKLLWRKGQDLFEGFKNGIWAVAKGVGAWILKAPVVKVLAPWLFAGVWLIVHGKHLMEGFKTGVVAVAKTVGTWMWNNVIRPVVKPFGTAAAWLYQQGRSIVGGLKSGVWNIASSVGSWVWNNVVRPIVRQFAAAATWLYQRGRSVVAGLKSGVWNVASSIGSWVWINVARPVVKPFAGAAKWLYEHGKNVIKGLGSGIYAQMKGISGWIKKVIVDPIIGAVKWFFGISSPSTVFAGLGGNLALGLFKGLVKGLSKGDMPKVMGKFFGTMPKALGHIVSKGFVALKGLPKAAVDALGSLGGYLGFGGSKSVIPQSILGDLANAQRAYQGTKGVEQWRAIALQALKLTGMPASWIGSLLRRMNQESGGNPKAINLTDSNARAGHPSMGLMQTILPTFNAYAGAWRKYGPWNPLANIIASIRYANAQYGKAYIGWNRAGGYKQGGWLMPGKFGYNETNKPEAVFNQAQLAMLGRGAASGHVHIHLDGAIIASRQQALDWLTAGIDKLKQQRRI